MARILMIAYTTYICDGRVKRHAEALLERGDDVDVICLAAEQTYDRHGVNVIGLPMRRYRGDERGGYVSYLRFFLKASLLAMRLSLKRRYDVVIVCSIPDAAVVCALLPKLFGARVLLDIHDTMPELHRDKFGGRHGAFGARLLMLEERASAWLADRVLAVHELHARRLVQSGIQAEKIGVVVNAPDSRLFAYSPNGTPKCAQAPFVLICHGTISRRLGLDVAIEAVNRLRERVPTLRLRVIGIGDYKERARALVHRLGLEQRVSFEDRVPIERLPAYLELARGVTVEPDLRLREGVLYHRFSVEMRLACSRPRQLLRLVKDCIDPRVRSDFKWSDLGPHLPPMRKIGELFRQPGETEIGAR